MMYIINAIDFISEYLMLDFGVTITSAPQSVVLLPKSKRNIEEIEAGNSTSVNYELFYGFTIT